MAQLNQKVLMAFLVPIPPLPLCLCSGSWKEPFLGSRLSCLLRSLSSLPRSQNTNVVPPFGSFLLSLPSGLLARLSLDQLAKTQDHLVQQSLWIKSENTIGGVSPQLSAAGRGMGSIIFSLVIPFKTLHKKWKIDLIVSFHKRFLSFIYWSGCCGVYLMYT